MINLGVSNNKLFFRSIGIIKELIGVSDEVARISLIKAIHEKDTLDSSILDSTISHHIEMATPKSFVLPTAMLIASGNFQNISSVHDALKKEPIVRNIINKQRK